MNRQQQLEHWSQEADRLLRGRTIVDAVYTDPGDGEVLLFLQLDNGTVLLPMRDDEGNGPGAMHWTASDSSNGVLPVIR